MLYSRTARRRTQTPHKRKGARKSGNAAKKPLLRRLAAGLFKKKRSHHSQPHRMSNKVSGSVTQKSAHRSHSHRL